MCAPLKGHRLSIDSGFLTGAVVRPFLVTGPCRRQSTGVNVEEGVVDGARFNLQIRGTRLARILTLPDARPRAVGRAVAIFAFSDVGSPEFTLQELYWR